MPAGANNKFSSQQLQRKHGHWVETISLGALTNEKAVEIKSTNQPIDKFMYCNGQVKIIWILYYFTSTKFYQTLFQTICHFFKYRTELSVIPFRNFIGWKWKKTSPHIKKDRRLKHISKTRTRFGPSRRLSALSLIGFCFW